MKRLLSVLFAGAFALGVNAFAEEAVPQILYNGSVNIESESIKNVNGRVMLPFRDLFETMGAEVEYENGMVTAKRDDTVIEFMTDGDVITVTKDGNSEEIVTDIGFDVENDKVLVPVRFVSQAMGASVGWEDELKTVVVLDAYPYIQQLKTNCPDFYKYIQLSKSLKTNLKSDTDMSIGFSGKFDQDTEIKADLKLLTQSKTYESNSVGNAELSLVTDGIDDLVGTKIMPVEGLTFDIQKNNEAIYIKTNAIKKVSEMLPEIEEIKNAAELIDADTWFMLERGFFEDNFGEIVGNVLFDGVTDADFSDVLQEALVPKTDIDLYYTQYVTTYFKTIENICKDFVLKEIDENSYTLSFEWDAENLFENMIPQDGYDAEEYAAQIQELKNMMNITIKSYTEVKDGVIVTSDANMVYNINIYDEAVMSITMGIEQKTSEQTEAFDITVPEDAVSVEALADVMGW